jgi:uncharacterized membrane protein YbaN (DUF454 family)
LGIAGIFLPLLPTTPFVLLSAWLFARSSEKMHNYMLNHRLFGRIIRDFSQDKSIPLQAKIISLCMMWTFILISVFTVATGKLWLQILLGAIAVGVTIHILSYKTKRK